MYILQKKNGWVVFLGVFFSETQCYSMQFSREARILRGQTHSVTIDGNSHFQCSTVISIYEYIVAFRWSLFCSCFSVSLANMQFLSIC